MSGPIAVLGGPGTFAWRAYQQIRESYGWVGEPRYLTEVDEMWAALREGQVEALCLAVETSRSGFTPTASVLLAEPAFHVIAESIIPYRCGLYVRKGSPLLRVQVVLGHRSLDLVQDWLREHLPRARTEVRANTLEAAREVAASDGSLAVVGSPNLPEFVPGIEAVARDVDGGAVARWWLVSRRPRFEESLDRAVLATGPLRARDLAALLERTAAAGLYLEGLYCEAAPGSDFRYRSLVLAGSRGAGLRLGELAPLQSDAVRPAGAFKLR